MVSHELSVGVGGCGLDAREVAGDLGRLLGEGHLSCCLACSDHVEGN